MRVPIAAFACLFFWSELGLRSIPIRSLRYLLSCLLTGKILKAGDCDRVSRSAILKEGKMCLLGWESCRCCHPFSVLR